MYPEKQTELIKLLDGSVELINGELSIIDDSKLRGSIDKLVVIHQAVFECLSRIIQALLNCGQEVTVDRSIKFEHT